MIFPLFLKGNLRYTVGLSSTKYASIITLLSRDSWFFSQPVKFSQNHFLVALSSLSSSRMKKSTKTLGIASVFLLFIAVCALLIPSRAHLAIEKTQGPDSIENHQYQMEVAKNFDAAVNQKVSKTLGDIAVARQSDQLLLADEIKNHGANSSEACNMYTRNAELEEGYCKLVAEIINKYGWLGPERIGAQNNFTLFTTIQNSSFDTQEKYLSVMENAVKSGSLSAESYAKLVDRKALAQHQQQIFGTQVVKDKEGNFKLAPVADASKLNERRASIGLAPLQTIAFEDRISFVVAKDLWI
jgi:hypothetical protein